MAQIEKPLRGEGAETPGAAQGRGALRKSPIAEGIRLGVPGRRGNAYSAYVEVRCREEAASVVGEKKAEMEVRGRKEFPSIVFATGHLEVGGKSVNSIGPGKKSADSICVFVFDLEGKEGDAMLDLLEGEEGSFFAGETECKVKIIKPPWAGIGPNDDTQPTFRADEKKRRDVASGVLDVGEALRINDRLSVKYEERNGDTATLRVIDLNGSTLIPGVKEGEVFDMRTLGCEDVLRMEVMTVSKKGWIELNVTVEIK